MLDAFEVDLRRTAIVKKNSDIVAMFLFLAILKAIEIEIVRGVKLLKEAYPETY